MPLHIDPDDLYDRLREEGLLEESPDGRLSFTDEFSRHRDQSEEEVLELDDDAYAATARRYTDEDDLSANDLEPDLLADAMAVYETCSTLDRTQCTYVARSIQKSELARSEPIPAGFLSLSADEIDPFLDQHPASVLYFWRDDCEPCISVKEDLETILAENDIPTAVGFGAVYGPDHVTTLREEYEVGAAPTILYCAGGTIESRFVGNPGKGALGHELSLLLEQVSATSETRIE